MPPAESEDAWKEQAGGLRMKGRFKSGSWLCFFESAPIWCGFFLQCVRLWRHAAGGHRNGVCLANVVRRLSVAECRNNRSGVFLIRKHLKTPKFKMLSITNLIFFV